MPNKRDKDKCGISVYVPSTIKKALKAEAKKQRKPMSELVTDLYREKLMALGYDLEERDSDND